MNEEDRPYFLDYKLRVSSFIVSEECLLTTMKKRIGDVSTSVRTHESIGLHLRLRSRKKNIL